MRYIGCLFLFFFNDTATTEIYTLSLHDALPIYSRLVEILEKQIALGRERRESRRRANQDRKSTRLNSSHGYISYAVFCLKKKKQDSRYNAALYHNTDTHLHIALTCSCRKVISVS